MTAASPHASAGWLPGTQQPSTAAAHRVLLQPYVPLTHFMVEKFECFCLWPLSLYVTECGTACRAVLARLCHCAVEWTLRASHAEAGSHGEVPCWHWSVAVLLPQFPKG